MGLCITNSSLEQSRVVGKPDQRMTPVDLDSKKRLSWLMRNNNNIQQLYSRYSHRIYYLKYQHASKPIATYSIHCPRAAPAKVSEHPPVLKWLYVAIPFLRYLKLTILATVILLVYDSMIVHVFPKQCGWTH